jgi:hypothetical protein
VLDLLEAAESVLVPVIALNYSTAWDESRDLRGAIVAASTQRVVFLNERSRFAITKSA